MGLEKHEKFIKRSKGTLTFDPGWSEDNPTGSWRNRRPVIDKEKCTLCAICWLYCPDGCIIRGEEYEINLQYCKGCGICAEECPLKAIEMVREESD